MSENVGLSTPRGSGTSGYVQRNLSHLKPRDQAAPYPKDRESYKQRRRPDDEDMRQHERLRQIEVKVLELQDELEEKELPEEEIEEQCDNLREKLRAELEKGKGAPTDARGLKSYQVHELAKAKREKDEKMRSALKIRDDYEEGGHWRNKDEVLRERGEQQEEEQREREAERERARSSR